MAKRIMIVEDHGITRLYLQELFKNAKFEVAVDDGQKGLKKTINRIIAFKPDVLIQDLHIKDLKANVNGKIARLKYNGFDILDILNAKITSCETPNFVRIAYTNFGTEEYAEAIVQKGAIAMTKGISPFVMLDIVQKAISEFEAKQNNIPLYRVTKKSVISRLLQANDGTVIQIWRDPRGITPQGFGSEKICVAVERINGKKFIPVDVIGLKLRHTTPGYGICLPVSWGCRFNCRICQQAKLGYGGDYSAVEMVGMAALVLEHCHHFGDEFWLYGLPFHVSFMGAGDYVFNWEEVNKTMLILKRIFGGQVVFNISTAFKSGVQRLAEFARETGIVPNLQASLHAIYPEIRILLVDSSEDPLELMDKAIAYAQEFEKINASVNLNFGPACWKDAPGDDSFNFGEIELLDVLKQCEHVRSNVHIKLTELVLTDDPDIKPVSKETILRLKEIAENFGFICQLFTEAEQAGIEFGHSCGNVPNEIPSGEATQL